MKHLISILVGLALIAFAGVLVANAQSYTPLARLPGTVDANTGQTNISMYLSGAIKLLIALGAALAILFAIIGGTQYVAAGISPDAKSGAKERIWGALIGLVIILTSYLLLNSINPKLVQFSFMLPPVGEVAPEGGAVVGAGAGGVHIPLVGGANPLIQPPSTAVVGFPATPSASALASANAQAQAQINAQIDHNNDYSIISHCVGNTSYALCSKTDLNGDGKTNTADVVLFMTRGSVFDVNQNKTLELESTSPAGATSCFFKTSTANINAMLPHEQWDWWWNENGWNNWFMTSSSCGGGGISRPPTVACSGATWLKFSKLGGACAANSGLLTMPLGFVYGANGTSPSVAGVDGQYSNFRIWITGASSGSAVSLPPLFIKTFLNGPTNKGDMPIDPYIESNLGKITYATIAQYDLNNDGTADFGAGGADMAVFNGCKGLPLSGSCAQADFNADGVIDDRDFGFVKFMQRDIFGSSGIIPLGWKLDWFESMMFDTTGYNDRQIINYCLGRTAFEKCGFADVNDDKVVNGADLTAFNTNAQLLDFNSDGTVNLE